MRLAIELIVTMLRQLRYYFRDREELPAFTVNLDDSESRWNQESKDEWDLAFREARGFLPAFSRLEAERLNGVSPAVVESEVRRHHIRAGASLYSQVNRALGSPILFENVHVENCAVGIFLGGRPALPATDVDVARYTQLMAAKGIEYRGPE